MATHLIKMPDLGEGIAQVELVAWRVRPGDTVAEDQVLADVMTDKATVEIPSPVAGRVLSLGGEVGQVIAVGAELIRLETELAAADVPPRAPAEPTPAKALARQAVPAPDLAASTAAPVAGPAAATEGQDDRPIASPAVRRRAWELGIDLRTVTASGAGGRILQADLDRHVARHGLTTIPGRPRMAREEREVIPVVGLRRKIAEKMQASKRHIPHFTYVEEVDVTELEALRATLNERWQAQRPHLTLLPFLMRAIVLAVGRFPQVNAWFDDEAGLLTRHGGIHIGIATQTPLGLMVPVVHHAEALDLWASATRVTELATAARAGRATRAELSGSTITLTSLGRWGGIVSTPVINHPEVAIVGVNRIVERPVIRQGVVEPRLMMNLSSSFDHRVIDGQYAAEFMQAIRGLLECPATLFVE